MLDWLLQSLEYSADADEFDRLMETLSVLVNLSIASGGSAALIQCGAPEKLCRLLNLDQPDEVINNALWTVCNISSERDEFALTLIERGVFFHVCQYMAELFDDDAVEVHENVRALLLQVVSQFLQVEPPLRYSVTAPIVPQLASALRYFSSMSDQEQALTDTLWSLLSVFNAQSEGVRFEDLLSGGASSLLTAALELLPRSSATCRPALLIAIEVAGLGGETLERVFTPFVLAHLRQLAIVINQFEGNLLNDLLSLLSVLTSDAPEMVFRVLESNVLQRLMQPLPALQRGGDASGGLWLMVTELSWVLLNVVTTSAQ